NLAALLGGKERAVVLLLHYRHLRVDLRLEDAQHERGGYQRAEEYGEQHAGHRHDELAAAVNGHRGDQPAVDPHDHQSPEHGDGDGDDPVDAERARQSEPHGDHGHETGDEDRPAKT